MREQIVDGFLIRTTETVARDGHKHRVHDIELGPERKAAKASAAGDAKPRRTARSVEG